MRRPATRKKEIRAATGSSRFAYGPAIAIGSVLAALIGSSDGRYSRTGERTMLQETSQNERGAALVEAAITMPLILLISVAIFEFGRAYQTWQVLTNAAREGARIAVLERHDRRGGDRAVRNYMSGGRLRTLADARSSSCRNVPLGATTASRITINYPFQFMVLDPVVRLVSEQFDLGAPLTMQAPR